MKTCQAILVIFVVSIMLCCSNSKIDMQNFLECPISELAKPDSLLTKEQLEVKWKLVKVIFTNFEVREDTAIYLLGKSEFLSEGLPESYYHEWMKNLDEINNFRRKHPKMYQETLKDLTVQIAEIKEKVSKNSSF